MHRVLTVLVVAVCSAGLGVSAQAAPPERVDEPILLISLDLDNEVVVLVNTTRELACTPEQVQFETDFAAWVAGGEQGDPPADPGPPEALDGTVAFHGKATGQGAIVVSGRGELAIEIWQLDPDGQRPLIGPCLDTDDANTRLGTGTVVYSTNDNDLEGSGTRGNAFGDRGRATLVDPDGASFSYTWRFHVNSECTAPDDWPRCLIEARVLR